MTTIDDAERALDLATAATIDATTREIRAALTLLAIFALATEPHARYVDLDDSDQGDWLIYCGLLDQDSNLIEGTDDLDDGGAASHLYDAHAHLWAPYLRDGTRPRDGGAVLDVHAMAADLIPTHITG